MPAACWSSWSNRPEPNDPDSLNQLLGAGVLMRIEKLHHDELDIDD
jgi:hypothetical protein